MAVLLHFTIILENYPYDFELKIKHVLEKNQVSVCWEVISLNDETMYFTIGGHPAFNRCV